MSRMIAGPEPESIIERYFLPTEVIAEKVRLHWSVMIEPFLSGVGAFILSFMIVGNMPDRAGGIDDFIILAGLGMLVRTAYRLLEWDFDRFIVTNHRIALVTGVLWNRRVAMMPLERVTDMTYSQTVAGRIFGWGTFVVESAGQDQALRTVDRIPSPDELYRTIMKLLFAPKKPAADAKPSANSDGS